jgi:hypothetical protein
MWSHCSPYRRSQSTQCTPVKRGGSPSPSAVSDGLDLFAVVEGGLDEPGNGHFLGHGDRDRSATDDVAKFSVLGVAALERRDVAQQNDVGAAGSAGATVEDEFGEGVGRHRVARFESFVIDAVTLGLAYKAVDLGIDAIGQRYADLSAERSRQMDHAGVIGPPPHISFAALAMMGLITILAGETAAFVLEAGHRAASGQVQQIGFRAGHRRFGLGDLSRLGHGQLTRQQRLARGVARIEALSDRQRRFGLAGGHPRVMGQPCSRVGESALPVRASFRGSRGQERPKRGAAFLGTGQGLDQRRSIRPRQQRGVGPANLVAQDFTSGCQPEEHHSTSHMQEPQPGRRAISQAHEGYIQLPGIIVVEHVFDCQVVYKRGSAGGSGDRSQMQIGGHVALSPSIG